MACKTLIVDGENVPGNEYHSSLAFASDDERSVATLRIISIEHPVTVEPGQVFTIKCTYQLCEKLTRNSAYELNLAPLENWPGYHGVHRRCLAGWPYACSKHHFWVWRLNAMNLYFRGHPVAEHTGADLVSGAQFTFSWTGTVEELTGLEYPESSQVSIYFDLTARIEGWYSAEWWPWNWTLNEQWFQTHEIQSASGNIEVYVEPPPPPPPYPVFNLDYCSVSKNQVKPSETFSINVRIVNQTADAGAYFIGCICEGKSLDLGQGTISGNGTVNRTFNVTANQLAQRAITESQMLGFSITVENEEHETDRWTPAGIAVIVTDPEPVADLSGRATDKNTGAGIAAVTVAIGGLRTSTNSSGYYSFTDLAPGSYTVTFTQSDYYTETKSKILVEGSNTLDLSMTPTTDPEPSEGIPWPLIALGGSIAVGAVIILSGLKRKK